MPIVGQSAIASVVFMTSISSTFLLQVVTYPYVTYLFELPPNESIQTSQSSENINDSTLSSRRFRAVRLNFLGNETSTTFHLSEADRNGVSSPFASFRLKKEKNKSEEFYVFGGGLRDVELQRALARPHECSSS
mmetsp:Transcript_13633/g.18657  ORF Transcript_13633/g.18657 Transcript_13633/m.18657 type:complete len:134 (+) Transcript_13633:79-480(+)